MKMKILLTALLATSFFSLPVSTPVLATSPSDSKETLTNLTTLFDSSGYFNIFCDDYFSFLDPYTKVVDLPMDDTLPIADRLTIQLMVFDEDPIVLDSSDFEIQYFRVLPNGEEEPLTDLNKPAIGEYSLYLKGKGKYTGVKEFSFKISDESYIKKHWFEVVLQTQDGSQKWNSPISVTLTPNKETGSIEYSYKDKNETIYLTEGKLKLDFLIDSLPLGYTFVNSKADLENISLQEFTPYSKEDPNYSTTAFKGSYCKTILVQKEKTEDVSISDIQSLEDDIPVFFECASEFNDYINVFYSNIPLGTTTFIKDVANHQYNDMLLKNVILESIRKNTHYETQPLITPVTPESIVKDLVAFKSGPNYSEILFYKKKERLILDDPRMTPRLKELQLEKEAAKSFLVTENDNTVLPVIDKTKIDALKNTLKDEVESSDSDSKYVYDFEINLDNSIVVVGEDNSFSLSLDLRALLDKNSQIKLLLSQLKSYLDSLLPVPLAEDQENAFLEDEMIETENQNFSLMTLEKAFAEDLAVTITVGDLFDGDTFNHTKALNAIQEAIKTEYSEYKNVLDQVDLTSHITTLEAAQLTTSSFPMELGEIVEIKVIPTEESTSPSKPSGGGGGSKPTTPAEPEETKPSTSGTVGKKMLYRFYNKLTGEHFFTLDEKERDTLLKDEAWSNEGHGWTTPEFSNYPIYRLCNPNNGDHHYTMDKNEYDTLQNTYGWVGEGVGLYSAEEKDESIVLLHRLYNPNATGAGSHHYTADENERNELVKRGWSYEGTAWYGLTDSES